MRRFQTKAITYVVAAVLILGMGPSGMVQAKEQIEKEETVYVSQLADGTVDMIRVSDTIKNVPASGKLSDVSHLTDIKNTKGNEDFTIDQDGNVAWEAKGKNISYEGNTLQKLPVNVDFSYTLDGKTIQPKELLGKSGKLELTINYQNTSTFKAKVNGKEESMQTPFLMVSVLILPSDIFQNVEVSQGKISDQDQNQIVTVYGMPGVLDSLNLTKDQRKDLEDDLNDTVTISMDVENFELSSIYTVATAELFEDIELGEDDGFSDLEEALDGLVEASDQLITGNEKLTEGIGAFAKNFGDYEKGIHALDSGASKLSDGTKQLSKGIHSYTAGVNQLTSGIGQYVSGTTTFANGVTSYIKGEEELETGVETLVDQTKTLPTQYHDFQTQLEGYVAAVNGVDVSADAVVDAYDHAEFATSSIDSSAIVADLKAQLASQEGFDSLSDEQKDAIVNAAKVAVEKAAEGAAGEQKAMDQQVVGAIGVAVKEKSAQAKGQMESLQTAGNQLVEASKSMVEPAIAGTVAGISSVLTGIKALSANNDALTQGATNLVQSGSGISSGVTSLNDASKKMTTATDQLSKGAKGLAKGTGQIDTATAAVGTGISQLNEGANALLSGTRAFKTEGTQKLRDQYDEKIKGLINRVNALSDGACQYQNFSGMDKDMKGNVKFIFTTEKIVKEEE